MQLIRAAVKFLETDTVWYEMGAPLAQRRGGCLVTVWFLERWLGEVRENVYRNPVMAGL